MKIWGEFNMMLFHVMDNNIKIVHRKLTGSQSKCDLEIQLPTTNVFIHVTFATLIWKTKFTFLKNHRLSFLSNKNKTVSS